MTIKISRKPYLAESIVVVDGFPGSGKTLLSPIIGSLDRVELPVYCPEVEQYCEINYLEKLSLDTASALIRLVTDSKLYYLMQGREINFRPTDLSSAFKYHDPMKYLQRLFKPGDQVIPEIIRKDKPILALTVHSLLSYSEPIWNALGKRCIFIEVVRHPLYMLRQQELNMERLLNNVRHLTIYYTYKDKEYPYWARGWENLFDKSTSMEKSVHYINQLTERTELIKPIFKKKYQAEIITVPFELFVLDPKPWLAKIASALNTEVNENTIDTMFKQKVPREKISQGIDLDIYRRCGWVPPLEGASEQEELDIRREDVSKVVGKNVISILDCLSENYEKKYMSNILE
jgi:hypothetical protein